MRIKRMNILAVAVAVMMTIGVYTADGAEATIQEIITKLEAKRTTTEDKIMLLAALAELGGYAGQNR